jgi:hypothetical protein
VNNQTLKLPNIVRFCLFLWPNLRSVLIWDFDVIEYIIIFARSTKLAGCDDALIHESPIFEEEKEEDMVQPKLGDVLETLEDDSNTQTQNKLSCLKIMHFYY